MRFKSRTFLPAALLVALAASPAIARDPSIAREGIAAPGPVAGAGLGFLVLAGGYYMVRRWRKQNNRE